MLGGAVCPSGHLAATWAKRYEDYPGALSFGMQHGHPHDEYYEEGIFVGYRWFDEQHIEPAYPFGYGLTYTAFDTESVRLEKTADTVRLAVRVTNTGERPGREVVQVYASAPAGRVLKAPQVLAAYAKTAVLNPSEEEELQLEIPLYRLASYEEEAQTWVLEKGEYILRTGAHSRAVREVGRFSLAEDLFFSAGGSACSNVSDHPSVEGAAAKMPQESAAHDTFLPSGPAWALAGRFTPEEQVLLCVGTASGGADTLSTIGMASASCPGAAGETTSAFLDSMGLEPLILADGPAGLRLSPSFAVDAQGNIVAHEPALGGDIMRMLEKEREAEGGRSEAADAEAQDAQENPDEAAAAGKRGEPEPPGVPEKQTAHDTEEGKIIHYQYCTAIPTASLLAQSWDPAVLREAGDIAGEEMEEMGVHLWLAPGMNIMRNPLCGRNFEYYSEDPLVSGLCASAMTQGVQAHPGCGTTIKHYACNNLEDNRAYNNSHVSEQGLREIYLKGFEIAVRASQPAAMMSSYNLLNGMHTANDRWLLTEIARGEWGFEGIIMTDWGTTAEPQPDLEGRLPFYGCSDAAACIGAGNDLIMPGSPKDIEVILEAVRDAEAGKASPCTAEDLQRCAARMISTILRLSGNGHHRQV